METETKEKMPRVVVTKPFLGILYMQVCACKDATDEEILETANTENLCGTTHGWGHVWRTEDDTMEGEQRTAKLPVQCVDDPDRMHYIISC